MQQAMSVTDACGIKEALQRRARHIAVTVPEGQTMEQFIANMVVEAKAIPDMAQYDVYELDALVREMVQH